MVVGGCNSRDRSDAVEELGGVGSPLLWKVVQYACEMDVYLAPTMLRDFQSNFRRDNLWGADFVYFTEQDQVCSMQYARRSFRSFVHLNNSFV